MNRVQSTDVKRAPHQHPPFTEVWLNAIHQIKGVLDEVFLFSVEDWEDGL